MVSFSCEGCNDTVKKPKLPQHYNNCGAPFTCIDCNTTFRTPNDWKPHTSCISEDQKYQKSLYKAPKGKGQQQPKQQPKQQQQQQPQQPAVSLKSSPTKVTTAPTADKTTASEPTVVVEVDDPASKDKKNKKDKKKDKKDKKRQREEETNAALPASANGGDVEMKEDQKGPVASTSAGDAAVNDDATAESAAEPAKKKSKKDKKKDKKAKQETAANANDQKQDTVAAQPKPTISEFLSSVWPQQLAKYQSWAEHKRDIVSKAADAGFENGDEVARALEDAVSFGGADKANKLEELVVLKA